jgi:hypothetical protein
MFASGKGIFYKTLPTVLTGTVWLLPVVVTFFIVFVA